MTAYLPTAQRRTLDVREMRQKTEEGLATLGYDGQVLRASAPNTKVGVPSFNLPALVSCPEATKACGSECYAQKGRFAFGQSVPMYWQNWSVLHKRGPHKWASMLVDMVLHSLKGVRSGYFRAHTSGDFFSQEYFDAWCETARRLPNVRFWAYTRTTTLDLTHLPSNFVIYVSADRENLEPAKRFAERWQIKMAYMGHDTAIASGRGFFACPEQEKKVVSCVGCGLCIHGRGKDVAFKMH
jgi:hypothetical protein